MPEELRFFMSVCANIFSKYPQATWEDKYVYADKMLKVYYDMSESGYADVADVMLERFHEVSGGIYRS